MPTWRTRTPARHQPPDRAGLQRARPLSLGIYPAHDARLQTLQLDAGSPSRHSGFEAWAAEVGSQPPLSPVRDELSTSFAQWRSQLLLAHALTLAARKRPMAFIAPSSATPAPALASLPGSRARWAYHQPLLCRSLTGVPPGVQLRWHPLRLRPAANSARAWKRRREPALPKLRPVRAETGLRLGLDALRDHLQSERLGHLDDVRHDLSRRRTGANGVDEGRSIFQGNPAPTAPRWERLE